MRSTCAAPNTANGWSIRIHAGTDGRDLRRRYHARHGGRQPRLGRGGFPRPVFHGDTLHIETEVISCATRNRDPIRASSRSCTVPTTAQRTRASWQTHRTAAQAARPMNVLRSLLFIPGDSEKKARQRRSAGADALVWISKIPCCLKQRHARADWRPRSEGPAEGGAPDGALGPHQFSGLDACAGRSVGGRRGRPRRRDAPKAEGPRTLPDCPSIWTRWRRSGSCRRIDARAAGGDQTAAAPFNLAGTRPRVCLDSLD